VSSIWGPLDSDGAVRSRLADLLKSIERPEIDITFEVAKATDQNQLGVRADADRVSIPLSKLVKGIAVLIIEGRHSRLVSGNDDEAFTGCKPGHVLNHVLEYWHVLTVSSSEDLDVLERMLTVVTLARSVGHVLRPNKGGVPSAAYLYCDFLPLMALNHELGAFKRVRL